MAGPVKRRAEMAEGRRVETVEWGLRRTRDGTFGREGAVEPMLGERHARGLEDKRYTGYAGTEVVKRTVVTYTTGWEAAPVSTLPEPVDMIAVLEGRAELPWLAAPASPGPAPAEDPQESLF